MSLEENELKGVNTKTWHHLLFVLSWELRAHGSADVQSCSGQAAAPAGQHLVSTAATFLLPSVFPGLSFNVFFLGNMAALILCGTRC